MRDDRGVPRARRNWKLQGGGLGFGGVFDYFNKDRRRHLPLPSRVPDVENRCPCHHFDPTLEGCYTTSQASNNRAVWTLRAGNFQKEKRESAVQKVETKTPLIPNGVYQKGSEPT